MTHEHFWHTSDDFLKYICKINRFKSLKDLEEQKN